MCFCTDMLRCKKITQKRLEIEPSKAYNRTSTDMHSHARSIGVDHFSMKLSDLNHHFEVTAFFEVESWSRL